MDVKYVDLGAQWSDIRERALPAIDAVLKSGMYLEHPVVAELESRMAAFLGLEHGISLNSGTDALLMSLVALGIKRGDEIITVPNSYIASVAVIEHVGATTVFVDVGDDHLIDVERIESAITVRTRAIMPVHLEGKMANMTRIKEIADRHGLFVIEDAAQSFGSHLNGKMPGTLSDVACFSMHPLKNLNAAGDGGFVATNSRSIAERLRALRNHGQTSRNVSKEFGFVSRLDSIQAAILNIKLDDLGSTIARRRETANTYNRGLQDLALKTPVVNNEVFHSYHLYVIEIDNRELIQSKLAEAGIETKVHYPTLICDQIAFRKKYPDEIIGIDKARNQCSRILSLPIHQNLTSEQIEKVILTLRSLA
jgi:dTDP-4-amino-4,6-dideoxygalactose transaminase